MGQKISIDLWEVLIKALQWSQYYGLSQKIVPKKQKPTFMNHVKQIGVYVNINISALHK